MPLAEKCGANETANIIADPRTQLHLKLLCPLMKYLIAGESPVIGPGVAFEYMSQTLLRTEVIQTLLLYLC